MAFIFLLAIAARAQESRSEVSAQATGFFTKDSSGQGVSRTATNTGGLMVGYRYHINRWLSAEGNYGFDRDTQEYFSNFSESRVKSDVHSATAGFPVKLPLRISKFSPYALGEGGGMIFSTNRQLERFWGGHPGERRLPLRRGYRLRFSRHLSLPAEYRGFVYKDPDFGVRRVNTNTWTHAAQPSAGIVCHF